MSDDRVLRLAGEVRKAAKARTVYPPFIVGRCADEIERRGGTDREIVKRVKRTLHQVGGAYLTPAPRYDKLLDRLAAAEAGPARLAEVRAVVRAHASMRERAANLDEYYAALFDGIDGAGGLTVLDLACGLNPLARPLMPATIDRYVACDLYLDMLEFVADASALLGCPVDTFPADLTSDLATELTSDLPTDLSTERGAGGSSAPAEVVLLLKTLPCLDQLDPDAGRRLLLSLATDGRQVMITYPVQSLGGVDKGMREHYAATFHALVDTVARETPVECHITELDLPAELGYRLSFVAERSEPR